MKKTLLVAMVAGAFLTSCAGSSDSKVVDGDGNCTEETVSSYNEVVNKAQMYSITKDGAYLTGLKNTCLTFKGLIGSKTCKALNSKSNEQITLSYSKVSEMCEAAIKL